MKQKRWWGGTLIFGGGMLAFAGLAYAVLNLFGDWLLIFLGVIFAYTGVKLVNRGKGILSPLAWRN